MKINAGFISNLDANLDLKITQAKLNQTKPTTKTEDSPAAKWQLQLDLMEMAIRVHDVSQYQVPHCDRCYVVPDGPFHTLPCPSADICIRDSWKNILYPGPILTIWVLPHLFV